MRSNLDAVASGSSDGQCPSRGGYVTTRGSTYGRPGAPRALVLSSLSTRRRRNSSRWSISSRARSSTSGWAVEEPAERVPDRPHARTVAEQFDQCVHPGATVAACSGLCSNLSLLIANRQFAWRETVDSGDRRYGTRRTACHRR